MKLKNLTILFILTTGLFASCAKEQKESNVDYSIITKEMSFSPNELHLKKGQTYRIRLHNEGSVLHDWNVEDIKANVHHSSDSGSIHHHGHNKKMPLHLAVLPARSNEIEFKAEEAGVFTFFCSVPGHKESGMVGKILVHD
ncbi:MAG TPA: cupredoxin domain-containing protein [Leptospiraceae bacterium]|nr:cupredoxin domain-containing protein [Leptospiraceae bacterium]HMW06662.1 cupredoxin domain-containing protein [Leptospiraceae bacterium]HMX34656.1 cupredoxin domain-containing protein [Leptospiraceae bacterium]HMY33713.1 cupredoxin domain-containing protein [Leptospiraceae bacterium]HMZ66192.1 cupredoxin domain-containing protein [Leptospiraceae bacterium]